MRRLHAGTALLSAAHVDEAVQLGDGLLDVHDDQIIRSDVRCHVQRDADVEKLGVTAAAAIAAVTAAVTATVTAAPLIGNLLSVEECRRDGVAGLNARGLQHLGRAVVGDCAHGELK